MSKRLIVVGALLLAACGGSDSHTSGPAAPDTGPNVGSVATAALTSTGTAKVVLLSTRLVDQPANFTTTDSEGFPVTTQGTCTGTDVTTCPANAVKCQNSLCWAAPIPVSSVMYAKTVPASTTTIAVPCDSATYTAEVYGSNSPVQTGPAQTYAVRELHRTVPFTMNAACTTPVFTNPTGGNGSLWDNPAAPAFPSISFSDIFVNMPAPSDKYTATATIAFPFTNSGWSVVQNGAAAVTVSGTSVRFDAPTTNPAGGATTIPFTATINLDRTVLGAGETWSYTNTWNPTVKLFGTIGVP